MNHVKTLVGAAVAAAMLSMAGAALAQKGETVKIGWVDPLSGLMAPVGQNQIKSYQYMAEHFSKKNPPGSSSKWCPSTTSSARRRASTPSSR
jgi:branched-chain amino acid transport system substrate-binding protein